LARRDTVFDKITHQRLPPRWRNSDRYGPFCSWDPQYRCRCAGPSIGASTKAGNRGEWKAWQGE
jgi:hypothetical protein